MTLQVWDRPEATGAAPAAAGVEPPAPSAAPPRPGGRRAVAAVVALALLLVVAGTLLVLRRTADGDPLDPRNAAPDGARAVAEVLQDRGVELEVARRESELLALDRADSGTTVVITGTDALSDQSAGRAWDAARGARRLVLVEPDLFVLDALDLDVAPAAGAPATRDVRASCVADGIAAADRISAVGRSYTSTSPRATACFTFDGSSSLVRLAPQESGGPEVVVLGAGQILANGEITRHDNAGVAVRLLGGGDRLVWYLPSHLDVSAEDTTAGSEVPRAVRPLTLLGVFALAATMLWRGRRFGPLVTEPLPAVVKAVETTLSRGRLYRRARDTGRATAILRAATVRRLAIFLGLPAGSGPQPVAEAVARVTGRPVEEVLALLAGEPPRDEAEMTELAHDLSTLEKEVHRP